MSSVTNPLSNRQTDDGDLGFDNRRKIGRYLREARAKRGLTQREIAYALGVGETAISSFETGRNALPPERYRDAADALGINRKRFMKDLLRYYNPWCFAMLFPEEMPESDVDALPERLIDRRKA
jgi:transcriptional regulator with XRE-family HTH domain